MIGAAVGAGSLLLLTIILTCFCIKRHKKASLEGLWSISVIIPGKVTLKTLSADDSNENKAHPDHIQADSNGFTGTQSGNGRVIGSPNHKTSRLNGVVPRMNITPNPLAADGDKVFTS